MDNKTLRLGLATLACAAMCFAGVDDAQAGKKRRRKFNPRLARAPLVLTSFVQNGRIDVLRNERLVFKFSAYLRKGTVDDRTLRIAASTGAGPQPATGARVVKGTQIHFDATRSQRNYDESKKKNSIGVEKDNPEGFPSFQDHVVEIPSTPDLHVLKNQRRQPILQEFQGSFRTNDEYEDIVAGQPRFVGDHSNGFLGFDPPRSGSTGLVDEDAVIVIEFSEPMDLNSLDPATTVIVERVGVGPVPGFIYKDPNEPTGRRFLFQPSLGFGSNEVQQTGWDIRVTLVDRLRDPDGNIIGNGITDLAGNPIKRPISFPPFRTRFVEGKPSASLLVESFNDQDHMDLETITQGGEWNTLVEGALTGGAPTTFPRIDIKYTTANTGVTVVRTRVAAPLVTEIVPPSGGGGCVAIPNGARVQMLYTIDDLGGEGAIVNVGWGPSSNALFSAFYDDVDMQMGHTSLNALGTDFASNINLGNPVQMYTGEYTVPQKANLDPPNLDTAYWNYPDPSTVFEYDGVNNVVFDAAVQGGTNCQIVRVGFIPAGISFPNRRAVSANANSKTADFAVDTVVYDQSFNKRRRTTRAISDWYETAAETPLFAQPIISPVGQSGGVQVLVEVEGANGKPDPFNPGLFVADPSTATGWKTQATQIDGRRFVRFRIVMVANLSTNQTARVNSFQMPFTF